MIVGLLGLFTERLTLGNDDLVLNAPEEMPRNKNNSFIIITAHSLFRQTKLFEHDIRKITPWISIVLYIVLGIETKFL